MEEGRGVMNEKIASFDLRINATCCNINTTHDSTSRLLLRNEVGFLLPFPPLLYSASLARLSYLLRSKNLSENAFTGKPWNEECSTKFSRRHMHMTGIELPGYIYIYLSKEIQSSFLFFFRRYFFGNNQLIVPYEASFQIFTLTSNLKLL